MWKLTSVVSAFCVPAAELFFGRKPALVLQMTLSNIMNIEGSTVTTTTIEMRAPRERSIQSEEIIPIFEYTATPTVAAKKPNAEVTIERIEVLSEMPIDSFLLLPLLRSVLYLVVMSIA